MSSYYCYSLSFEVSFDRPQTLHLALRALAAGKPLSVADMPDLPPTVADYLAHSGMNGDGVHVYAPFGGGRLVDGRVEIDLESPQTRFHLNLVRTFHDDEYYNGGIYFPYWLMQFVANDGPIGTRQQTNGGEPHAIITRQGGDIIVSQTAYSPSEYWPIPGQAPPDADQPLVFSGHQRHHLAQWLRDIDMFSGYAR
jgi:hypothetical protein